MGILRIETNEGVIEKEWPPKQEAVNEIKDSKDGENVRKTIKKTKQQNRR